MALHTLGTTANTSLNAVLWYPPGSTSSSVQDTLSYADCAAINQSIVGPGRFAGTNNTGGATGILATGTTHSNTTLDTLVATGGGPLAAIQIGMLVLGVGITPGTFVSAIPSSTSVTLSQAATASASSVRIAFIPANPSGDNLSFGAQKLTIPGGRGVLTPKPGDYIAIDNTGWPILVSSAAVGYAGSLWHFV